MEENEKTQLHTLLKVKSRKGLGFFEWVWFKCHKNLSSEVINSVLDDLWQGKFIQEEPWRIDDQGRELIPSLPHKRFLLTNAGRNKLRRLKWKHLWMNLGKSVWCLILLLKKIWWLIAAVVVDVLVRSLFPDLLQDVRSVLGL